jgi:hypothetical protein
MAMMHTLAIFYCLCLLALVIAIKWHRQFGLW